MSVSPVAKLNEIIMARTGNLPQYNVIRSDVGTHKNTFWVRVSCCIVKNGQILSAEGKGASKKEANSEAAVDFRRKHLPVEFPKPFPLMGSNSNCLDNITGTNRHTMLQNLCMKCKLNQPVFKEGETTGPPHARHFKSECTVSNFTTEGEGSTKSEAKLNATTRMLKLLREEVEVEETFKFQNLTLARHGVEVDCLNGNPRSPQVSAPAGVFVRSISSSSSLSMLSASDFSIVQIPVAPGSADTASLIVGVINHPAKVDKIAEGSSDSASSMNMTDLHNDLEPKLGSNKVKSKSLTNLADGEPELSSLDKTQKYVAHVQAVAKIETTLEKIEKQLYDEILSTLENRHLPRKKTITFLSHEFDVYINWDSKPKILEGTTVCDDASIRIASLTKLLMDLKEYAIANLK